MVIKVTFWFWSFEFGGLVGRIEFWYKILKIWKIYRVWFLKITELPWITPDQNKTLKRKKFEKEIKKNFEKKNLRLNNVKWRYLTLKLRLNVNRSIKFDEHVQLNFCSWKKIRPTEKKNVRSTESNPHTY